MPSGLVLKSGRVRLPDKLIEYLNAGVAPEVLYWQTGGESFSVCAIFKSVDAVYDISVRLYIISYIHVCLPFALVV